MKHFAIVLKKPAIPIWTGTDTEIKINKIFLPNSEILRYQGLRSRQGEHLHKIMSLKARPPEISIHPFEKAVHSLSKVLNEPKNAIIRDATIQRFEYTFELSWKLLKRYFKLNNNLDLFNVKDIFREAGKQGLIDRVEIWFEFLDARNLTSHTYDENITKKVYEKAREFERQAITLLNQFKRILNP